MSTLTPMTDNLEAADDTMIDAADGNDPSEVGAASHPNHPNMDHNSAATTMMGAKSHPNHPNMDHNSAEAKH